MSQPPTMNHALRLASRAHVLAILATFLLDLGWDGQDTVNEAASTISNSAVQTISNSEVNSPGKPSYSAGNPEELVPSNSTGNSSMV
jgi:hypothetical protein